MSALPSAVRKQVAEADRLAKEYYASMQPPAGDPPTGDPAQPAPPANTNPPPGNPPADPPTPPNPPLEGWEQKYRVLQGKYNAEVPRLTRRVSEQDGQIQNLQSQLTTVQNLLASLNSQRGTPPANEPATPPAPPARLVKDEEIREFGPDLIDVVRRVAREEHATLLPEIDRRVAPVKQRADQAAAAAGEAATRVARNDQQSVFELLTEKVPKWSEQNEDPGFLEWLDQRDPYSGQTRGALLTQAMQAHDGPRVVAFFLGYQKEHAAVTPPPNATPPATPPAQPQRSLEQMVAPGTPKTGAASTQNGTEKRVWTRAEIAQYYADVRNGKFKAKVEEAKKLEADIFAAQREGRIR